MAQPTGVTKNRISLVFGCDTAVRQLASRLKGLARTITMVDECACSPLLTFKLGDLILLKAHGCWNYWQWIIMRPTRYLANS